jgi:hypothetical protein
LAPQRLPKSRTKREDSKFHLFYVVKVHRLGEWLVAGLGGFFCGSALVGHLCVVAVLPVSGVADDLGAAVGKQHAVLAAHDVSVGHGVVALVDSGFDVLDGVDEVEGHAGLVVVVMVLLDGSLLMFCYCFCRLKRNLLSLF